MTTNPSHLRMAAYGALPLCINQEQRLAREELAARRGERIPPSNLVSAAQLRGPLDCDALAGALEALMERHTALRSSTRPSHGMPPTIRAYQLQAFAQTGVCDPGLYEQSILATPSVTLPVIAVDRAGPEVSRARIAQLFNEEAFTPFEYAGAPMMRARLVRNHALDHVLLLTMSHMVCDSWALPVVWQDLLNLYTGRGGADSELAPQYHEFATWQAEQKYTGPFRRAISYWKERWSGLEDCQLSNSDLGWGRPEGATPQDGSSIEVLDMDDQFAAGVHRVCRACGVTPDVIFLTAFARLIHRSTGKSRVIFWLTCPNRRRSEAARTVGWLSNLHIVEIDVSTGIGTAELVDRCDRAMHATLSHQELPLAMLWSELGRNCSTAMPPIIFDWQMDKPIKHVTDLTAHRVRPAGRRSPVLLGFCLTTLQYDQGFRTSAIYSNRLFLAAGIRKALRDLRQIVASIARDSRA